MRKREASSHPTYSSGGIATRTSSLRSATIASTSLASNARVSRSMSSRSAGECGALTRAGDQISAITRFDNSILLRFGLPRKLAG